jgi:hypothetical protein
MDTVIDIADLLNEGDPATLVYGLDRSRSIDAVFIARRERGYELAWPNTDPYSREALPIQSIIVIPEMCSIEMGGDRLRICSRGHYVQGIWQDNPHLPRYERMLKTAATDAASRALSLSPPRDR